MNTNDEIWIHQSIANLRTRFNVKDTVALTVTLPPKLYKYCCNTQYDMTYNTINSICSIAYDYAGVVELTKAGNVHFHFVLRYRDKCNLITIVNKLKKNRLFGFYCLKQIMSDDQLLYEINYLFKELNVTKRILHTSNYKPNLFFNIS